MGLVWQGFAAYDQFFDHLINMRSVCVGLALVGGVDGVEHLELGHPVREVGLEPADLTSTRLFGPALDI